MAAMLLSNIGRTAYFVSMTWIALNHSGSVRFVAVLLLTSTLAQFLSSGISGYVADFADRRRLSISLDILRALIVAVTGVAVSMEANGWPLFLSMALFSVADRGYLTSMQSIIPVLTSRDSAVGVNSASYLMMQTGGFAGAILAGVFLRYLPHGATFSVTAATFLSSAIALGRLQLSQSGPPPGSWSYAYGLKQIVSIRQLKGNGLIFSALHYSLAFAIGVLMNALLAAYVAKELKGDAVLFGKTESAWAFGSVFICLLLFTRFAMALLKDDLAAPLFVSGSALAVLGIFASPTLTLVLAAILGAFYNLSRVCIDVRVQRTVSVELLGRVKGAIHMLSTGIGLSVYALIGLVGGAFPPSYVFTGFGLFLIVAAFVGVFVPNDRPTSVIDGRRQER